MKVSIKYQSHFSELVQNWKQFKNLEVIPNIKQEHRKWDREGSTSYDLQCIIMGKTGYGKSTLLNKIVGKNIFETSSISSTTLQMQCADYLMNQNENIYFSLVDLPGIGQSTKDDEKYMDWYRKIVRKTDCFIYLLRADTREYTIDLEALKELNINKNKLIFGMNFCDKIEPINRSYDNNLTEKQLENLNNKIDSISNIFDIPKTNIIPFSADTKWNFNKLIDKISNILTQNA